MRSDTRYRSGMPGANLVTTFIRHPNAANLLMALLILFGLFALARINTQFFPTVERPVVRVVVSWPGSSAEDVETNVLAVVEPSVRFIDGVDTMTSYAREGSGTVRLEFFENADMRKATADVEAAVEAITTLPDDAETPTVTRSQFFDNVASLSVGGNVPEALLREWAKRIRDDLIERGIDKVDFSGLRDEELHVDVIERQMRRFDLTVADVASAITANSRDLPSGNIDGAVSKQLRTVADFKSPAALADIEVRSFTSGEKVTIGDLGTVSGGYDSDAVRGYGASMNRAIELDIRRAPTADTLETAAIFLDYVEEIRPQLPPGLTLEVYEVSANALSERILLLIKNGLGGLVLVVAILFLFLNFRIAFWVAMGIPVATLATLGFMLVSGQSVNMISLFGMIMMLGIIVDDAIVVGEHTDTRLSMGDDPVTAAENGVTMMFSPVTSALATTAASFAPILLITGGIGQIMGVLPLVVLAVLLASMLECFFILPGHLAHALDARRSGVRWSHWRHLGFALSFAIIAMALITRVDAEALPALLSTAVAVLSGWQETYPLALFASLLGALSLAAGALVEAVIYALALLAAGRSHTVDADEHPGEGRFRVAFDRGFARFRDGPFACLSALSYHWRYVTVAISVGLFLILVGGLVRGGHVGFVFFPSPEAENIRGNLTFNAGTPEETVIAGVRAYEQALRGVEQELGGGEQLVSAVFVTAGQSGFSRGDNLVRIKVQLTTSERRSVRTSEIIKAWRAAAPQFPSVRQFSVSQTRGGPPGRDIDVRLQGADAGTLKTAATEVTEVLNRIAGVSGVEDDLPYGKPELIVELTPRGSALGFTVDGIGRQLRNAFEGTIPRRFARGDDEVSIRVSQVTRDTESAAIRNLELRSPAGEFVPLGEVVTLRETQGFAAIQRIDGKTTLSVSGDIDPAINTTDDVIAELTGSGALDLIASKHGVSYSFSGRAEEQRDAFADLGIGALVALSCIYIILAWQFGSYFKPLAVMLIIPFGVVGAVTGHWLLDYQLTILSVIGVLGLAGILVNDSIILVTRLQERLASGEALAVASIGASRDRLRAVLLTSLTTIGGLLPLMYEKSLQAQFIIPMAITIIFGLATATLLVLFLVPALVAIGYDIRWFVESLFGSRRTVTQPGK